jgi:hypothetical protein
MEHQSLDTRILQVELAKLRQENTQLRKRLGDNTRHQKRIEKAYEDALLMAFWRSVGIKPSRRFAALYDITQDRWQNAICLLRMARLIEGRSRWPLVDMETTERKLSQARDRALADCDAFFLRHIRHRKS